MVEEQGCTTAADPEAVHSKIFKNFEHGAPLSSKTLLTQSRHGKTWPKRRLMITSLALLEMRRCNRDLNNSECHFLASSVAC